MKYTSPNRELYAQNGICVGELQETKTYNIIRNQGSKDYLALYTQSGSGEIITKYARYKTSKGDFILWKPGTYQDYRTNGNTWHLKYAHFLADSKIKKHINWSQLDHGVLHCHIEDKKNRKSIETLLDKLNSAYRLPFDTKYDLCLNYLEEIFIWTSTFYGNHQSHLIDNRIISTKEFICGNFKKDLTLDDISDAINLSTSRIVHLFKKQTGQTIMSYLEEQRLIYAQSLLQHSSYSISKISEDSGFNNPFYFTNRFRKFFDVSPSTYRKNFQKSN
jgi:AraC family transcriptional regulator of arabinose operon